MPEWSSTTVPQRKAVAPMAFPFLLIVLVGSLSASPATLPERVALAHQESLVFVQEGDIPLLLTAPHGGSRPIPGVSVRTSGVTAQDARTRELAEMLLAELETLLSGRPSAVVALFHRRYVDANRPASDAFEHPAAAPHYEEYHAAIQRLVERIGATHPSGALLLDLHGQAQDPNVIHRGTKDGRTAAHLTSVHGEQALVGELSVFGQLQAAGYHVFPPNTPVGRPPEDRRFNGGYTVTTYGSGAPGGIDAVQIEIGATYREPETLPRLAADLARALATFYRAYLATGSVILRDSEGSTDARGSVLTRYPSASAPRTAAAKSGAPRG